MKNLRSWAIATALVGAVGLTAYAAAESGTSSTTATTSSTTEVNIGCQPYPVTGRGTVIIRYVDTEGKEIEEPVSLTQDVGTSYDTTPYEKATIAAELTYTDADGKTHTNPNGYYSLIKAQLPTNETGTVTEETQYVTYVYDIKRFSVVRRLKVALNYDQTKTAVLKEETVVDNQPVGTDYAVNMFDFRSYPDVSGYADPINQKFQAVVDVEYASADSRTSVKIDNISTYTIEGEDVFDLTAQGTGQTFEDYFVAHWRDYLDPSLDPYKKESDGLYTYIYPRQIHLRSTLEYTVSEVDGVLYYDVLISVIGEFAPDIHVPTLPQG